MPRSIKTYQFYEVQVLEFRKISLFLPNFKSLTMKEINFLNVIYTGERTQPLSVHVREF